MRNKYTYHISEFILKHIDSNPEINMVNPRMLIEKDSTEISISISVQHSEYIYDIDHNPPNYDGTKHARDDFKKLLRKLRMKIWVKPKYQHEKGP